MSFSSSEKEEAALNQYWYSPATIATLVAEVEQHATRAAFLSAPSLYFSLVSTTLRAESKLFEFDRRWAADPGFVFYDYNAPEKVPVDLWEQFDYVVVDPPFITEEVWREYARTVKLILAKGGKILFTSVIENHQMLEAACEMQLMVPLFRPSIPHLTYQYHCFTNYPSAGLDVANPELPPEEPKLVAARQMANDMRESQQAFAQQVQSRDRRGELPLPAMQHRGGVAAGDAPAYDPAFKWDRVPEGLTEYANGAAAPPAEEEEAAEDLGPEYAVVEATRTKLEAFKRGIDAQTRLSDALLKAREAVRRAQGSDKAVELQAVFSETLAKRVEELASMRRLMEEVVALGKVDGSLAGVMAECLNDFQTTEIVKEKLQELSADATRKYKSKLFNRQRELLQEMKAIKAEKKKERKERQKDATAAPVASS